MEVAVDMPVPEEDMEFIMEAKNLGSPKVEVQRKIESALYMPQKTTMDHHTKQMVETKAVRLL